MTYTVSRDGTVLGTYSEEGIDRQLNTGTMLPTDLAFLEKEQRWVAVTELPKAPVNEAAEFTLQLETAGPPVLVTPALIAINVLVFLAMALNGMLTPTPLDLIRWGGDLGPLVAHGEWWRLITATFLHAGILHIGMNMWVLFSGGRFTERLFGSAAFLALFCSPRLAGVLRASGGTHRLFRLALRERSSAFTAD